MLTNDSRALQLDDVIEKINAVPVKGKVFDDVVKSFVGPVSTRLFLTIIRGGESRDVAVVRHNRLTTAQAQASLRALHVRLSAMTIYAPGSSVSDPANKAQQSHASTSERAAGASTDEPREESVSVSSEALGLDLRAVNGEWHVQKVQATGPLQGAGLVVGDVLLEVDSIVLKNTKAFDVVWALDGPAALEHATLAVDSRYGRKSGS